jgi:hypothetical protein
MERGDGVQAMTANDIATIILASALGFAFVAMWVAIIIYMLKD